MRLLIAETKVKLKAPLARLPPQFIPQKCLGGDGMVT